MTNLFLLLLIALFATVSLCPLLLTEDLADVVALPSAWGAE